MIGIAHVFKDLVVHRLDGSKNSVVRVVKAPMVSMAMDSASFLPPHISIFDEARPAPDYPYCNFAENTAQRPYIDCLFDIERQMIDDVIRSITFGCPYHAVRIFQLERR